MNERYFAQLKKDLLNDKSFPIITLSAFEFDLLDSLLSASATDRMWGPDITIYNFDKMSKLKYEYGLATSDTFSITYFESINQKLKKGLVNDTLVRRIDFLLYVLKSER